MIGIECVELSVLGYATEDSEKLVKCLRTIAGYDHVEERITTSKAKGHYGDEINVFSLMLKDKEASLCARKIFSSLSKESLQQVLDTLELRFDRSRLFLRVSKFQAYLGRIALVEGNDSIKVVIKFKGYLKDKTPLQILKEAKLIGEDDA